MFRCPDTCDLLRHNAAFQDEDQVSCESAVKTIFQQNITIRSHRLQFTVSKIIDQHYHLQSISLPVLYC